MNTSPPNKTVTQEKVFEDLFLEDGVQIDPLTGEEVKSSSEEESWDNVSINPVTGLPIITNER